MSTGVGVDLQDMWIKFGDFVAVREANVNIKGGDFFSFLGPVRLWQNHDFACRFRVS